LENNYLWLVNLHYSLNNALEQITEGGVINAITEGHIYSIMFPFTCSNITYMSSSRKEVPILVERNGHDSVRSEEGLLHTISVVDINVYV
jgi:hypothetical protein